LIGRRLPSDEIFSSGESFAVRLSGSAMINRLSVLHKNEKSWILAKT